MWLLLDSPIPSHPLQVLYELLSNDDGDYSVVWAGTADWSTLPVFASSACIAPSGTPTAAAAASSSSATATAASNAPSSSSSSSHRHTFRGSSQQDPLSFANHAVLASALQRLVERFAMDATSSSSSGTSSRAIVPTRSAQSSSNGSSSSGGGAGVPEWQGEVTTLAALLRQLLRSCGVAQVWRNVALALALQRQCAALRSHGGASAGDGNALLVQVTHCVAVVTVLGVALELPSADLYADAVQVCVGVCVC